MRRSLWPWLLALALLLPVRASATFHLMVIDEIFFGTAAAPEAQYVVLRMTSAGQGQVSGHPITVRDADGTALADFGSFTANVSNQSAGDKILMCTALAQSVFGVTCDKAVTGSLPFPSGRICFSDESVDCVAYGAFTGNNGGYGSPAPAPQRSMALVRGGNTSNNANDFSVGTPAPENNAGSTGALPVCGDGTPDAGEECDEGAANSDVAADACRTTCQDAFCGDDVTDTGEDCDDAGESATCNADCSAHLCGDGITNTTAGEDCDTMGESATCDDDCTVVECSDFNINQQAGESCDDGNTDPGDGCSSTCVLETCGDGTPDPGEECDEGAGNSDSLPDACRTNCLDPFCGDSVKDTGEACDTGGASATCNANCTVSQCGDGIRNQADGEQCDEGPANSDSQADACRTDCQNPTCGDDAVDTGEQCDDGNATSGDGCSALCKNESGLPSPSAGGGGGGGGSSGGCQMDAQSAAGPGVIVLAGLFLLALWRRRRRSAQRAR